MTEDDNTTHYATGGYIDPSWGWDDNPKSRSYRQALRDYRRAWLTLGIVIVLLVAAVVVFVLLATHTIGPNYQARTRACHSHGYQYWQERDICVIEVKVP